MDRITFAGKPLMPVWQLLHTPVVVLIPRPTSKVHVAHLWSWRHPRLHANRKWRTSEHRAFQAYI